MTVPRNASGKYNLLASRFLRVLCLAIWLTFAGCDSPNKPALGIVRGIVVLNGKRLTRGTVISYPESGRNAVGHIQSDGTFELETNEYGKGAVVGQHRHTVIAYEDNAASATNAEADLILMVPARYAQPNTSGLSVTVTTGGDERVELKLTR
jgi:hypothetical protein